MPNIIDYLNDCDVVVIDFITTTSVAFFPEGASNSDVVFEAECEESGEVWEYSFTLEELETAEYDQKTCKWVVSTADGKHSIRLYNLNPICPLA